MRIHSFNLRKVTKKKRRRDHFRHNMEETQVRPGNAKLQERLQRRNQARMEDAERRKEAKESRSVAEEKGEYFSGAFNRERADIEELLSGCCGPDRPLVARRLEEATARTGQLQKFLNDSLMFLTQYELRQAQAALQKLQTSIAEAREEALPKKKFAFRARTKAAGTNPNPNPAPPEAAGTSPAPPEAALTSPAPPEAAGTPSAPSPAPPDAASPAGPGVASVDGAPEQCGFSNLRDRLLTKTAEEIQGRDVLLTHLSNCRVRLIGSPGTLHLRHVHGCEVLCGPVSGSVFVDRCSGSTLAVACQQLRTHNSSDTRVYLHVASRAIIEDCRGLSFAPFSWSYPTLDRDFAVSGLDRRRNNWREVDDFNWLASGTPSPNWTVLPEADRRTSWDS